jgi:hypothetical protein
MKTKLSFSFIYGAETLQSFNGQHLLAYCTQWLPITTFAPSHPQSCHCCRFFRIFRAVSRLWRSKLYPVDERRKLLLSVGQALSQLSDPQRSSLQIWTNSIFAICQVSEQPVFGSPGKSNAAGSSAETHCL